MSIRNSNDLFYISNSLISMPHLRGVDTLTPSPLSVPSAFFLRKRRLKANEYGTVYYGCL